jgi:hypothetical protein
LAREKKLRYSNLGTRSFCLFVKLELIAAPSPAQIAGQRYLAQVSARKKRANSFCGDTHGDRTATLAAFVQRGSPPLIVG